MTATDGANLRDKVRIAYSAAAEKPEEKHAFPVGRGFAESLAACGVSSWFWARPAACSASRFR
jgi:hypothetical protein